MGHSREQFVPSVGWGLRGRRRQPHLLHPPAPSPSAASQRQRIRTVNTLRHPLFGSEESHDTAEPLLPSVTAGVTQQWLWDSSELRYFVTLCGGREHCGADVAAETFEYQRSAEGC